ncbi:MAG: DUF5666 domain-containing protein [candidate division KSB1 bacterium]
MKPHVKLAATLASALCLLVSDHGSAQTKTAADLFSVLKPGQWVKIEGAAQKDMTVIAKEVKLLTGDFQDDDCEIEAPVRAVLDKTKKRFQLLTIPVTMEADAKYESDDGSFTAFEQLKPGMFVEVEGAYLKDGSFLADEVQPEIADPDELGGVVFVGKAEKVEAAKRTITIMGVTFHISEKTKVKSVIK